MRLLPVRVTEHSRPVLLPEEQEKALLDKVDLLFEGVGGLDECPSEEYKGGYAVLTSLRLVWVPQSRGGGQHGAPCAVPLHAVSTVDLKGSMLKATRVKLMVRLDEQGFPTGNLRRVACLDKLKLVCRAGNVDSWYNTLQLELSRSPWLSAPPATLAELRSPSERAQQPQQPQPGPQFGVPQSLPPRPQAGPKAQWGVPQPLQAAQGVQPDPLMVHALTTMGFPSRHAAHALIATKNAGVQVALDWLLNNAGSPLLEQPLPLPYASELPQRPQPAQQQQQQAVGWGAAVVSASTTTATATWGPLGAGATGQGSGMGMYTLEEYSGMAGWVQVESAGSGESSALLNPLLAMSVSGGAAGLQPQQPLPQHRPQLRPQLTLGSVGVGGLLRREERRAAETEHSLEQAFSDLRNLMTKAGEMVQLAERFRVHINRKEAGTGGEEGEELDAETALDLIQLGIVNPVTKESAGKQYHQQLARQLAEFLKVPVERFGGLMPLPDVYCLFNRARGTELVSPDDVLAAAKLFTAIGAPLQLREFGSGVKVVQAASHSDEQVCRQLAAMVSPAQQVAAAAAGAAPDAAAEATVEAAAAVAAGLGPGITATDVAAALSVPLAVAGEHLLTAEARGVLCRDDGPEGLRFFRNFFADVELGAAAAG